MSKYELVLVLNSEKKESKQEVDKIISDLKFKVVEEEDMEVKELAYKINGQTHGAYFKLVLEGEGSAVSKLENELNLSELVLRHLLIALPPKLERVRSEMAEIRAKIQAKKAKEAKEEEDKQKEEDEVENTSDKE